MVQKILTASANSGMGIWTMICFCFSSIFGISSKNYRRKQEKVISTAKNSISLQLKKLEPDYYISNLTITNNGPLSVTIVAVVTNDKLQSVVENDEKVNVCPHCGFKNPFYAYYCGKCLKPLDK